MLQTYTCRFSTVSCGAQLTLKAWPPVTEDEVSPPTTRSQTTLGEYFPNAILLGTETVLAVNQPCFEFRSRGWPSIARMRVQRTTLVEVPAHQHMGTRRPYSSLFHLLSVHVANLMPVQVGEDFSHDILVHITASCIMQGFRSCGGGAGERGQQGI